MINIQQGINKLVPFSHYNTKGLLACEQTLAC